MNNETTLQVDDLIIRKGKTIFRAINHPLRQQILHMIHRNTKMIVTDIYKAFEIDQPVASQQLAILRRAGLVLTVRDGKHIYYSVNYDRIKEIHECSDQLLIVKN